MGLTSGIVVFVIIWWCVFFTTLPWGNRAPENPEPGHVESAPDNPRLWLKAGITTAITLVLWAGVYWAVESGLISFRDMATR